MEHESSTCTYDELGHIILNGSSGPCCLPLEYLRRITNNFSDERLLGEGGFGKVYKGVLPNGKMVAVKRLDQLLKPGVQERQFENEVYHLMRLKHPNIVRFLGYCYETRNECLEHDGKFIFAEMQQKLICLEYLPNGSLDRHLSAMTTIAFFKFQMNLLDLSGTHATKQLREFAVVYCIFTRNANANLVLP